jgi:S1-C subfamily serine protease
LNLVDAVVIVLAGLSAFRGWRLGFLGQIFELGGGFLGLILGVAIGPRIASAFTDEAGLTGALISLIVVFVLMSVGQTLGHILGHRGATIAARARLGGVNQAIGAAFGVVITIVSFWLIGSLLVHGPSRPLAKALRQSTLLRATTEIFPRPPNVLAYFQQYLNTSGFPQVFAGLPPALGPPVKLPSNAVARRAAQAADDSMLRVIVPACGGEQLGSGWIAAPSTVVTNAHVVAGGDSVTLRDLSGADHPGTVVLFDPKTDVAVIHSESIDGPVLQLETEVQDRGTPGATLGFPGDAGGQLVTSRAAVQAYYENASGRDIYGRATVTRSVYELRAAVRQGDSGGPFVLSNGSVAGVVFAASTTDSDTGYALTGEEVSDEIDRGAGRTEAVGTGGCTR